jgi:hypothetical protein
MKKVIFAFVAGMIIAACCLTPQPELRAGNASYTAHHWTPAYDLRRLIFRGLWAGGPQQSANGRTYSSPTNYPQVVTYTANATIGSNVVVAQCGSGISSAVTLTLPYAASGTHRKFYFVNLSPNYACKIATYNGTDTIDGATATYTIGAGITVPYSLFDAASGAWLALAPVTANQAWAGITGSADVTIGSSPTLIENFNITAPSSAAADMCVVGQVEYTNSSSSNGTMTVYTGLWGTSTASSAACQIDYYLPTGQTPNTVVYECCAYQTPSRGTQYAVKTWAATSLSTVVAKYQATTGVGYATNENAWILASF